MKKSYNENSIEGYLFEVGIQYSENIQKLHNDLSFLPKIKTIDKVKKLW